MKVFTLIFVIIQLNTISSFADLWIPRAEIPSYTGGGVAFAIVGKGYMGAASQKQWWGYDPIADAWTQKADFGGGERMLSVGFAINGKGYVCTGLSGNDDLNDLWEYDPLTNMWLQKANLPGEPRQEACGFALQGKGYVGTGSSENGPELKDFWQYDPVTDTWIQKADFGGTPRAGAIGFTINDKGYIGTGRDYYNAWKKDLWQYDPDTDSWTEKADIGSMGRGACTAFEYDGLGYLGMGVTFSNNDFIYLHDVWQYQPGTNSWIQKTDYAGGAGEYAMNFIIDKHVFVGSGQGPGTSGKDFWEYTPDSLATYLETPFENQIKLSIYPNLLIYSTKISFYLNKNSLTTIEIFESSGAKIKTIIDENLQSGIHQVQLKRENLSAGIYFLKIKIEEQSLTKKIIIE